ncbi:hypothetical protein ACQP2U_26930 [Nocardia sp. CA-084685]|uniref:hypothetical protein n=1 Tax=Nocardia sp. CA-084685 TaxID=3239970 RepID=UPI003D9636FE
MAVGSFTYQNGSGYSDRIDNPDEYRTYNIAIGRGAVDNQTNATVWLYARGDGQGDSIYVNPGASTYVSTGYQSCKFTS